MPYTTLIAGAPITAAWANANVRDQAISKFASVAARDAAITTPVAGLAAYTTDFNLFWVHNGTVWMTRQMGTVAITLSGVVANGAAVTFPVAFPSLPRVTMSVICTTNNVVGCMMPSTPTTTGFNVNVISTSNVGISVTGTVHWMASNGL